MGGRYEHAKSLGSTSVFDKNNVNGIEVIHIFKGGGSCGGS